MTKKELWLRLHHYHFENLVPSGLWNQVQAKFGKVNPSTYAFAQKLATKQGWKNSPALQAVLEYKKFVYLGVVSDFIVTPSQVIDQVWHQHILFSKAYRSFCTEVIEYDFDHHPELLPNQTETEVYQSQYLDTLQLYHREFGTLPPESIWGKPKFSTHQIPVQKLSSKKKELISTGSDGGYTYQDPAALHTYFDSGAQHPSFEGFNGGEFSGAGAGGSWIESSDSSSDSSSSCSSCSSSCGGGD